MHRLSQGSAVQGEEPAAMDAHGELIVCFSLLAARLFAQPPRATA